jgi:hypothetical protein
MNANLFNPGLGPDLCAHAGRAVETLKTPLDRAKEHRLEAYATLFSGLPSDT